MISIIAVFLFMFFGPCSQKQTAQFSILSWGGITPGITTREFVEKKLGTATGVSATSKEEIYVLSGKKSPYQDDLIKADNIRILYVDGIVTSMTIVVPSGRYDVDWIKSNFGTPDVWIVIVDHGKAACVFYDKRMTILLTGTKQNSFIQEIIITAKSD